MNCKIKNKKERHTVVRVWCVLLFLCRNLTGLTPIVSGTPRPALGDPAGAGAALGALRGFWGARGH